MNFRDFEELVPDDEDLEVVVAKEDDENAINGGSTSKVEEEIEAQNAGNEQDHQDAEEIESKYVEIGGGGVPISNKRQKIEETLDEEAGEDRISELPDSVLIQILSLLPTIEEVIRTGILSKRWQYLWTTIPILNFVNDDNRSAPKFASFVDITLIQCRHSKIDKFKLDFEWDKDGLAYGDQIYSWIHYAVACKVEELEIWLHGNEPIYYHVPRFLLAHSCLTNLKLGCVHFPPSKVNWKLLKRLLLYCVDLSGEVIENILTGCPLLEVLNLESCGGVRRLDINSTSVKTLIIKKFAGSFEEEGHDWSLEISAPTITSLELTGSWSVKKLVLIVGKSIVEAKVDFHCPGLLVSGDVDDGASQELAEQLWIGLLKSLKNVNELSVGNWCLSVLGFLELQFRPSPRSSCKCLIINNSLRRRAFIGFVNLIRSLPVLETLLINANPPFKFSGPGGFHTRANYLAWRQFHLPCLDMHLRTVKIAYYVEWDREGEVIQFLLENACVLEEVVIHARSVRSKKLTSVPEVLLQLTQKLLSFPRASKDAVVTFCG